MTAKSTAEVIRTEFAKVVADIDDTLKCENHCSRDARWWLTLHGCQGGFLCTQHCNRWIAKSEATFHAVGFVTCPTSEKRFTDTSAAWQRVAI